MGNIYKLISVNQILGRLKMDFDYLTFINEDHFIEWIGDALRHIGSYNQLIMKEANVEITNHKGLLPCDCYKVYDFLKVTSLSNTIRYNIGVANDFSHEEFYLKKVNDLQDQINASSDIEEIKILSNLIAEIKITLDNEPFKYRGTINSSLASNMYTNSTLVGNIPSNTNYSNDIKVEFDTITTGFSEGYINVKYLALPVDEEGFPLIPDDISYYEAIYWYIARNLARQNKLNNPQFDYNYCKREWGKYCVQARANSMMPTLKETQELMNENLKLVPDINEYYSHFINQGKRQIIKRH